QAMEGLIVILDKMPQKTLEIRPKGGPLRGVTGERLSLDQPNEKCLSEIFGILVGFRPCHAEMTIDRLPVAPAKLFQGLLPDFERRVASAREDLRLGLGEFLRGSSQTRIAGLHFSQKAPWPHTE